MGKLDDKVALVTGSSSGIGRAIARAMATEGAAVALAARRSDRLRELADQIVSAGGAALPVQTDVTSEADVERLFAATVERFGRLDILVNNAGTSARGAVEELPVGDWDRVIAVNLRGPFLCAQQALRIMKPQRSGRIINIGSISAQRARPSSAPYTASKFGLDGLTHVIALEGRPFGISCGALHPGNTETELNRRMAREEPRMDPDDLAQAAVLMAAMPPTINVFQMIVLPVEQLYVGRG